MARIIIDLDVMLAAYGRKLDERKTKAINLIREVKTGKHELYTPYVLIELMKLWKIEHLRKRIERFLFVYSTEIASIEKVNKIAESLNIDAQRVKIQLSEIGVKEEDSLLAIIASLLNLELKTFNKKHLLSKQETINKILKESNMNEITISEP